jgi:hypothetical protein
LDKSNVAEDDCTADTESDIQPSNGIEDPVCPEQWDVSTASNVPGLIQPTQKSNRQGEKEFLTVNAIETRMNQVLKKQKDRMHHLL